MTGSRTEHLTQLAHRLWERTGRHVAVVARLMLATALVLMWALTAPTIWATLVQLAEDPAFARVVFTLVGGWLLGRRALRRLWRAGSVPRLSVARRDFRPEPRNRADTETVARHEAAHAVVATALGARVIDADVTRAAGWDGHCSYTFPAATALQDLAYARIAISLAGNVIDLATGRHDTGSLDDVRSAHEMAAAVISTGHRPAGYAGPLTTDGLLEGGRVRAAHLLAAHRSTVDDLATDLAAAQDGRLTAHQLDELHRRVAPGKEHEQRSAG